MFFVLPSAARKTGVNCETYIPVAINRNPQLQSPIEKHRISGRNEDAILVVSTRRSILFRALLAVRYLQWDLLFGGIALQFLKGATKL